MGFKTLKNAMRKSFSRTHQTSDPSQNSTSKMYMMSSLIQSDVICCLKN